MDVQPGVGHGLDQLAEPPLVAQRHLLLSSLEQAVDAGALLLRGHLLANLGEELVDLGTLVLFIEGAQFLLHTFGELADLVQAAVVHPGANLHQGLVGLALEQILAQVGDGPLLEEQA